MLQRVFSKENQENALLILLIGMLIFSAFWFRFVYLGYSNLQSDEIKALCTIGPDETTVDFLLRQRKGPVQFLINCVTSQFNPTYANELALRLPFAIANSLAVLACYLLAKQMFDRQIGILAGLFFATNGLMIGFARIVQYQSITLLCTILGIYGFLKAVDDENWKIKGLYLGFAATAIGMLAHFDSAFSIPPMLFLGYLWWQKYRKAADFQPARRHLVIGFTLFAIPLLLFYIPYALGLAEYQLGYWEKRISTLSPSNTLGLYRLYNPGPVLWVHLFFLLLGLFQLRRNRVTLLLGLWFFPPLLFMEGVMSHPATHFYTYLLPLFSIAALGFQSIQVFLQRFSQKYAQRITLVTAILVFGFLSSISHFILIDHTPEYPWETRVIWKLKLTGHNMGATFGFPYYRNWQEIGAWFNANYPAETDIISNEYGKIGGFYLPETISYVGINVDADFGLGGRDGIVLLWIEEPRSEVFEIWGIREPAWKAAGTPLQEFRDKNNKLLGSVYYFTKAEIEALAP